IVPRGHRLALVIAGTDSSMIAAPAQLPQVSISLAGTSVQLPIVGSTPPPATTMPAPEVQTVEADAVPRDLRRSRMLRQPAPNGPGLPPDNADHDNPNARTPPLTPGPTLDPSAAEPRGPDCLRPACHPNEGWPREWSVRTARTFFADPRIDRLAAGLSPREG